MSIYINGSLAYDRIMSFPGKFEDHILADKVHMLNVSFMVSDMQVNRGGNAGNIAYTLALLNEKPIIVASAGKDFASYQEKLVDLGLSLEGIRFVNEEFTAGAYITTDSKNNQITGFHPAAMMFGTKYDIKANGNDVALIGPGNINDMLGLPQELVDKGIKLIYDPGQQIPWLSADDLIRIISLSHIFISNDYEFEMICNTTKKTKAEILAMSNICITTLGEEGSVIQENGTETKIGICKAKQIVDPTGCGDAYRSGLIKGMVNGFDLKTSAQIGAVCSTYCLETSAPQGHEFTIAEFVARYKETFNEDIVL